MKISTLIAVLFSGAATFAVNAFDTSTHAAITQEAWQRAKDADIDLMRRLGIFNRANAFGSERYFDVSGNAVRTRSALMFERTQMPAGSGEFSIAGWLMRGAVREDDDPDREDPSPKGDDPDGDIHRVLRHFFDPFRNIPLTSVTSVNITPCDFDAPTPCAKAVDWALGTTDYRIVPVQQDPDRRNHFTIFDAREALYRALTGHDFAFNEIGIDIQTRNAYWASTFRALGDVVHLNQDMAQPQHTRNDPHSGKGGSFLQDHLTGHKSTFEKFVEASMRGETTVFVGSDTPPLGLPMTPITFGLTGYPAPNFANYSDYWTRPDFKGLADFSNRRFFTAGTNLGSSSNAYPLPDQNAGAYRLVLADPVDWNQNPIAGAQNAKITFLVANVHDDNLNADIPDVRMSASSVWDQFLQNAGSGRRAFTLMRENYIDQANLLLPRAAGYSAGLLQYFFRGKLKISLPSERVYAVEDFSTFGNADAGFKKLKVMVQNNTADIPGLDGTPIRQLLTEGQGLGSLVAVIRYRRNVCLKMPSLDGVPGSAAWNESCRQPDVGSQLIPNVIVSDRRPVPAGINDAPQRVIFTLSTPLPFDATDVDMQVVYRGPLGSETDGIAVGFEFVSDSGFVNFDNFSDCLNPTTCTPSSTDPQCIMEPFSAPLPFTFAGPPNVVNVGLLKPGQYSRVAYITYAAWISEFPGGYFVPRNQNFLDPVTIIWPPTGEVMDTWSGASVTPFDKSRKISGNFPNMYSYDGAGIYGHTCNAGACNGFQWAAEQCTVPIDPTPQPVQVTFDTTP